MKREESAIFRTVAQHNSHAPALHVLVLLTVSRVLPSAANRLAGLQTCVHPQWPWPVRCDWVQGRLQATLHWIKASHGKEMLQPFLEPTEREGWSKSSAAHDIPQESAGCSSPITASSKIVREDQGCGSHAARFRTGQ